MGSKLLIFDFADTIAFLNPSKEEIVKSFIKDRIQIEVPLNVISNIYHHVGNLKFYSSVDIKNSNEKESFYIDFNNSLLSFLGMSQALDSADLYDCFLKNSQHWELKDNFIDQANMLKEQGYLISLLSNFDSRLANVLKKMNIYNMFDSIFISQDVGLEKPNLNFFELPLKHHNVKPKDSYFLGDSFLLDFVPATKIGMNAILLDENNNYPYVSNRIQKLSSLSGKMLNTNDG
jgi:HAD superfamily hydrolase (TIGR01549 family)